MSEILMLSRSILSRYPLCDRCLGRLFANLGRGLSNLERGRAIKLALLMMLHADAFKDPGRVREELYIVSRNAGEPFSSLYSHLYGDKPQASMPCYVCGGRIEDLIETWVKRAGDSVKALGASRFILGVRPPRGFVDAEEEIASAFSLQHWESVKNELKREIGKRIAAIYGLEPDFNDPEVVLVLDLERDSTEVTIPPLTLDTRLVKLVRGLSVKRRSRGKGSLEEVASENIKDLGRGVNILIPIRDTSRYRILGGCESIVEIRSPEPGKRDLDRVAEALNKDRSIFGVEILGRGSRRIAEELSTKIKRVVYRAHIYLNQEVRGEAIESLAKRRTVSIEQKTPSRILKAWLRGSERVVKGEMRIEKIQRISARTIEILFSLQPNIYAEEAITGDSGRTSPSISSLLGVEITPLEIDVIRIEI